MDYVKGAKNLREFIESNPRREDLLSVLVDVAKGIDCLHSKEIVHCDIKDENILVKDSKPPHGLISDLGYAQVKVNDEKEILVRYTDRTAHPHLKKRKTRESDPAAATARIARRELSFDFDLFAFGKTILDLLPSIEERELLDAFDVKYLRLIILRLMRGYSAERPVLRGIPEGVTEEIQYKDSEELLEDLVRLGIYW